MSSLSVLKKCNVATICSLKNLSKYTLFGEFSTDCKNPSVGNSANNERDIKATNVEAPAVAPLKKTSRNPVKKNLWTSPTAIVRGDKEVTENCDTTTDNAEITLDDKSAAERAWLDSGYIEYMDNQRDKGWKT
jgi:hypothetical protein